MHVLVIQHRDLKGEELLQVLHDDDEEGQLDAEHLFGVRGAGHKGSGHVGAANLKRGGLDVGVRDALDVAIAHCGWGVRG